MNANQARFSKRARLLKPAEFSRVFDQALRSSDRLFIILVRLNDKLSSPRLGLAISKKNARLAVDRNRIKRIIRESFRHNLSRLPAADFVVMARPVTRTLTNQALFDSLDNHWNRLIKQCEESSSD
ncbi:MAG: ribonuclease P protein component [Gammaproteobacteria bacterium]